MNTNKLESFAQAARIKLIDLISRKLDFVLNNTSQSFIDTYASQLSSLNDKIKQTSREQVIETVAYTWFNRFMALRFMDANGYTLPKVITPLPGMSNPEILQNALAGHIEADMHLDRQRLNDLLDGRTALADAHTEAYKMLIVAACNQWYTAMPFMFERISDYTELLLPDDLLSDYSIVADIRNGMTDEDCQQEEILGWLYQFYISAENARLIKSKKAYAKHELAPASQLFTPKWIVKYMVDNTLGQLWSEMNPSTSILRQLEFYITPAYKNQLAPRTKKRLEEIKFFDPCVGSGHILVYAFDVFYLMYEEQGYNTSEIPELIIKHNLFGTDIDERAAQIAAFVLTMKGRRKNSRFLRKGIMPSVTFYQDFEEDAKFSNAKAIGSLINVSPEEMNAFKVETGSIYAGQQQKLKQLYTFLGQRYDCVVTNPPYISSSRMEGTLKQYVEANYQDTKSDLFATFIIRCMELCNADGLTGYMTPFVWMFISSYQKLRENIIDQHFINNLIQLEYSGFDGATVPICTFTLRNSQLENAKGSYIRLSDFKGSENQAPRTLEAIQNPKCGWFYTANQNGFEKIPGSPIGYWLKSNLIDLFQSNINIGTNSKTRKGMATGLNAKYVRQWNEINFSDIGFSLTRLEASKSKLKWFPYANGGNYRKWYGNYDDVVNWENDGNELQTEKNSEGRIRAVNLNLDYIFKEGASWTSITSGIFSIRYLPKGFLFSSASNAVFNNECLIYLIGVLNCKISSFFLKAFNPTLNANPGDIGKIPLPSERNNPTIKNILKIILDLSKNDWDATESSWDFQQSELIKQQTESLKVAFESYKKEWSDKFYELHRNEEELNRQFIEIYGLQDELTPDVPLEEITILQEEGKIIDGQLEIQTAPVMLQLISYAVGCMFGRYSLDKPGLILANQGDTVSDYVRLVDGALVDGGWLNNENKYDYGKGNGLQGVKDLAAEHESGYCCVSSDETYAQGGTVQPDGSDKTCGSERAEQYSGGSGKGNERISSLSAHSHGVVVGTGNSATNHSESQYAATSGSIASDYRNRESEKTNKCTHEQTQPTTVHQPLTTVHQSPITNHRPPSTVHFLPDEDNIIPVLDGEWFSDDIVGRFKEFIKVAFSPDQLNENIGFIEDNIPAKDIRRYFVKDFYNDHIKRYKKRPIYWMFSSPKGHFKALIYMHRYQPDTCSVLLNDYLQPFIAKLESAKQTQTMLSLREDLSPREKVAASKEIDNLQKMIDDCRTYERTLFTLATQKISMDLDDGVKVNYQKFKDVLVPIKGLEKEEE